MSSSNRITVLPTGRGPAAPVLPQAVRYTSLDRADLDWLVRFDEGSEGTGNEPTGAEQYDEVFATVPTGVDPARLDRTALSRQILTVELAVPPGRVDEWNEWYHREHMPSVVDQMAGAEAARRFAPRGRGPLAPYLVVYEFVSRDDLWRWQTSTAVGSRRDDYVARWGVRNVRHAFAADG